MARYNQDLEAFQHGDRFREAGGEPVGIADVSRLFLTTKVGTCRSKFHTAG